MSSVEILVVDDEAEIRKLLDITLKTSGYGVRLAENGKSALHMIKSHNPDIVLLDIGLPDLSGHEVLRQLREWYSKPVIMLSVRSAEQEIVNALDQGANDYLVKPFRTGELLARIRSATRLRNYSATIDVYTNGGLSIDFSSRETSINGNPLRLTSTEFRLISLFARNEGRVMTHDHLLTEVWGGAYREQTQYLRVFVASLRKKIEPEPNQPQFLLTESGVGYRFVKQETD
jgi:two-component system, OmpR family, KDP operon response regulator KdpE